MTGFDWSGFHSCGFLRFWMGPWTEAGFWWQGPGVVEWRLNRPSLSFWKFPVLWIRKGSSSHALPSFLCHSTQSAECDHVFAQGFDFPWRIGYQRHTFLCWLWAHRRGWTRCIHLIFESSTPSPVPAIQRAQWLFMGPDIHLFKDYLIHIFFADLCFQRLHLLVWMAAGIGEEIYFHEWKSVRVGRHVADQAWEQACENNVRTKRLLSLLRLQKINQPDTHTHGSALCR